MVHSFFNLYWTIIYKMSISLYWRRPEISNWDYKLIVYRSNRSHKFSHRLLHDLTSTSLEPMQFKVLPHGRRSSECHTYLLHWFQSVAVLIRSHRVVRALPQKWLMILLRRTKAQTRDQKLQRATFGDISQVYRSVVMNGENIWSHAELRKSISRLPRGLTWQSLFLYSVNVA